MAAKLACSLLTLLHLTTHFVLCRRSATPLAWTCRAVGHMYKNTPLMHIYPSPGAPLQVRCESDPVHWLCHISDEAARRLGDLQRSAEEAGLDLKLPQTLHR